MKRIEVEPLSEQRWSRVERELFASLDQLGAAPVSAAIERRRLVRTAGFAFAIGACAASLALWLLAPALFAPQRPQVAQLETRGSAQRLSLGDHQIEAAPESSLLVGQGEHAAPLIALLRGSVELHVKARDASAPAVVRAGNVQVRATLAHFHVALLAFQARIDVKQGRVEVWSPEGAVTLAAGQSWPVAARVGSPDVVAEQPRAPAASVREPPEPAPVRAPRPELHGRGSARAPRQAPLRPASIEQVDPAPPARADPQARYEQAAGQEGTHPEQAIAIYRELAQGAGAWAENALYALGRLELERGHRTAGRAALAEYLARHPAGRNAEDARRLLNRP